GREDNLRDAIERGARVEKLDVRAPGFRELVRAEAPDVIVHLAAQIDVRRSVQDPIADADLNILGTLAVLEAAREAKTDTVLIASSGGTIYGEPRKVPVAEAARTRPVNPYGISKRVLNDYAEFYRDAYGIRTVLLALGNVYGPRQDPHGEAGVVAIFLGRMLRGETPVIYGDGSQVRDYVYVTDAADAFARAMDADVHGTINIATGKGTSVSELFKTCARTIGYKGKPDFAPPRPGELQASVLDVGLAARALGWKPKTALTQGLKRTATSIAAG
ncbi:MAG TPA: GDP-mannose 4,6-dehydratase, partial [Actinomycetota bacterium]|nr:GDP-mannose 4,6-dehydratase [Actinomycetota bacterium]